MGARPKPFYRRWWFRAPEVLMVLAVFGAADNFGDPSSAASSGGDHSVVLPAADQRTDKGWFLAATSVSKPGGDGDFGGSATVMNTGHTAGSAIFTITLVVKGTAVANLAGSVQNVPAGKTVTVQLTSHDDYAPGPFILDFRTDASFH
ncbi:MAG: hypothetical protein ABI438_02830 [Dermatophilaceae bacterium]